MNRKFGMKGSGRCGIVLLTVLVLLLTACFIVAALTSHSVRSMMLARRGLAREKAFMCAESGLGYAVMAVRNRIARGGDPNTIVNDCNDLFSDGSFPPCPCGADEDPERPQFTYFPMPGDRGGKPGPTILAKNKNGGISVTIQCGAYDTDTGVYCALEETVATQTISSSCDFLALFDGDLEMDPTEGLHLLGKIHSNSSIFAGGEVYIWDMMTCCGGFYNQRKDAPWWGWKKGGDAEAVWVRKGTDSDYDGILKKATGNGWGQMKKTLRELAAAGFVMTWDGDFNWKTWKTAWGNGKVQPTFYDDTGAYVDSYLEGSWLTEAQARYEGRIQTGDNGTQPVHLGIAPEGCDAHKLIERSLLQTGNISKDWKGDRLDTDSLSDEVNREAEDRKFANRAALTIYVGKDGTVRAFNNSGTDYSALLTQAGAATKNSDGTYSLTGEYHTKNRFFDQREQMIMAPVDIYVDKLLANVQIRRLLYDMAGNGDPGLIYITRDQPDLLAVGTAQLTKVGSSKTIDSNTSYYVLKNSSGTYVYTPNAAQAEEYASKGFTHAEADYSWAKNKNNKETYSESALPTGATIKSPNSKSAMSGKGTSVYYEYHVVTITNSVAPVMPCVRIRNASDLSDAEDAGISFASDLPIYVEGDFNTNGEHLPAPKNGKQTENNSPGIIEKTDTAPRSLAKSAMVAGDAVTILSANWDDSRVAPDYQKFAAAQWTENDWKNLFRNEDPLYWHKEWSKRMEEKEILPKSNYGSGHTAANTVFNGIVMTGIVPTSGGSSYSGGMQNIFRYMEDWGQMKNKNKSTVYRHDFNGSIICLWDSILASNQLRSQEDPSLSSTDWRTQIFTEPERRWQYAKTSPPGLSESSSNVTMNGWKRIDWIWEEDGRQGHYDELTP